MSDVNVIAHPQTLDGMIACSGLNVVSPEIRTAQLEPDIDPARFDATGLHLYVLRLITDGWLGRRGRWRPFTMSDAMTVVVSSAQMEPVWGIEPLLAYASAHELPDDYPIINPFCSVQKTDGAKYVLALWKSNGGQRCLLMLGNPAYRWEDQRIGANYYILARKK